MAWASLANSHMRSVQDFIDRKQHRNCSSPPLAAPPFVNDPQNVVLLVCTSLSTYGYFIYHQAFEGIDYFHHQRPTTTSSWGSISLSSIPSPVRSSKVIALWNCVTAEIESSSIPSTQEYCCIFQNNLIQNNSNFTSIAFKGCTKTCKKY